MSKTSPRVVIVGAGLAGISAAVALKTQLHHENFTIYEKASDVGGTWRDNTYPGCGSDTPAHWYSLSTELNSNWSSYKIPQAEIQTYWKKIWLKYDLDTHTAFNSSVHTAVWDNDAQLYHITITDTLSGVGVKTEAEVLIWAIGGFHLPKFPNLEGVEEFRGGVWHSARWRHDVDLTGKRVGVIGNGCSAAQFVPQIAANPSTDIVQFCRTPQYYKLAIDYAYPAWVKIAFAYIPGVNRLYRNFLMARADLLGSIFFRKDSPRLSALARKVCIKYLKDTAPKDQVEKLTPSYAPGCKRIIVDPGYLKCLHQPNIRVEWTGIDRVVPEGVRLVSGETIPLDVLIFGTGYTLESGPHAKALRGIDGSTLHEYYESQGGPTAYLGTCTPGFPNTFILLGPNTATGHASVIFTEEVQIQYALQLIKPILQGTVKSFSVRASATSEYNSWLQTRLQGSVWTDCSSYYRSGSAGAGKIFVTFPGPVSLFWWICRNPKWDDFEAMGAERWVTERRARRKNIRLSLGVVVCTVGLGAALWSQDDTQEWVKSCWRNLSQSYRW